MTGAKNTCKTPEIGVVRSPTPILIHTHVWSRRVLSDLSLTSIMRMCFVRPCLFFSSCFNHLSSSLDRFPFTAQILRLIPSCLSATIFNLALRQPIAASTCRSRAVNLAQILTTIHVRYRLRSLPHYPGSRMILCTCRCSWWVFTRQQSDTSLFMVPTPT